MLRHVLLETIRLLLVTIVTLVAFVGYGLHGWVGVLHGSCDTSCSANDPASLQETINAASDANVVPALLAEDAATGRCSLCDLLAGYRSFALTRPKVVGPDAAVAILGTACPWVSRRSAWRMPPSRGPPAV